MYAMKTRSIVVLVLGLIVGCSSVLAQSNAGSPESVVAALYRAHKSKTADPFFNSKSRVSLDKYFVKSLADLIWKDSVTSAKNNEVGVIDGDPLYNAQDMEIKNFAIGRAVVEGETAVVPVTFTNFGKKQTIKFDIKKVGSIWKVDDINYGGDAGTLRKWFKDSATPAKSAS
jgi:hypothetical protein